MHRDSKIYIAGHTGLVGSAVVRELTKQGYTNLVYTPHVSLDLTNQQYTDRFMQYWKPDYVFLCAAKVGGIVANQTQQADFLFENLAIATNVIQAAKRVGVKKLLNLGSSCIYPRNAPQPIREEYLMTGELEPTNEGYALAKIAALKLCHFMNRQYGTNFLSAMPTNLYGNERYVDVGTSHVIPSLIKKFHDGKIRNSEAVMLWGSGQPRREFLHADDLARCLVKLMQECDAEQIGEVVNVGYGKDITIKELAKIIAKVVGYPGSILWDETKPDGMPRKLLDCSKLHKLIDWEPTISLEHGIKETYAAMEKSL